MFDISNEHRFLNGAWHLVYYISSERQTAGSYSYQILRFKDGDEKRIAAWGKWAKQELSQLNINFDYTIRALSSKELKIAPVVVPFIRPVKGLDFLGKYLEKSFGWKYVPQILEKNRVTPALHTLRKHEREEAIHMSYFVANNEYNFGNKNILILDDVTTSQTTVREIIRALKAKWPNCRCYLFCLGRTSYDENGNKHIVNAYFNQ